MWLTDPELFLYSKVGGDDVQVWRCKKTMMNSSPLVVPMVLDDFEYVSQVEDHSDLVDGNILDWEETDYKALVKYISERRLLVNGQGLVIAELSKFSEEDEDDQTDADILPIYLRSLDILQLKAYIPDLREQPIPSRKVQYLEDADGKAAPVEGGDSTTTTTITTKQVAELQDDLKRERSEKLALAKRVADAEAENKTLEAKNVNLDGTNTKLKQDLADAEAENKTLEATNMNQKGNNRKLKDDLAAKKTEVDDLESKDKASVEKVTKLKADLVEWKQKFADLESKSTATDDQEERIKKLNEEMVAWRDKAGNSESTNKTQEERIRKLNADVDRGNRESEERIRKLNADVDRGNRESEERIRKLNADLDRANRANRESEERIRRLNADLDRANQESWRNDMDVTRPEKWLAAGGLRNLTWTNKITILRGQGAYTVDDQNSNVRASYWCQVRLGDNDKPFKGVAIRDLAPNREKARFRGSKCFNINANGGILYVLCSE